MLDILDLYIYFHIVLTHRELQQLMSGCFSETLKIKKYMIRLKKVKFLRRLERGMNDSCQSNVHSRQAFLSSLLPFANILPGKIFRQ